MQDELARKIEQDIQRAGEIERGKKREAVKHVTRNLNNENRQAAYCPDIN